ncbi:Stf0 family sulfotransferase [Caenimonas aquaedulcis]|uniref:Sulphotransferase Stf0 domain-containing protein n=1 Tax=Caenimonas aquaedulcis TaxID=2793270 RepID=A0A931MI63_9BURK|nr:Stf0 family sulfotransferase [Caenimonas aquaedulcis]MBG9389791.1 hypothetical protein [Caenimonas aquaedulcis]
MVTIAITDKHKREMSPERDFPEATPVTLRYGILSSPRSGSTLLGRLLHETKAAGDPQEFFNPPLIALERQKPGNEKLNMNQFLRVMEKRRTSPNGVFGMKMHYSQVLSVFRAAQPNQNVVNFLRKFDKLIWIRRRDRIGQAISQAVAAKTNVWSSEDTRFRKNPDISVHPYECVETLRVVARDDTGWEQLVKQAPLDVHQIWYEDLVSQYEEQGRQVLRYLGIDGQVAAIPAQPIEKQSGELNDRLRRDLHAYLGLPPVA